MFLASFAWPGGSWEATLRLGFTVVGLYLAVLWLTLVFWTYRDIRQRTRDPIIQMAAVLVVLVFFLPGHWVYLILRPRTTLAEMYERSLEEEALLQELEDQKACPACKRRVLDDFLICPSCRARLKEPCRACAKPLSYAWVACPYCGLEKPPREAPGQRGARNPARAAAGRPAGTAPVGQAFPPRPAAQAQAAPPPRPVQPDPYPRPARIGEEPPAIDATAD